MNRLGHFIFFFYLGMLASKVNVEKWLGRKCIFNVMTVLYILFYLIVNFITDKYLYFIMILLGIVWTTSLAIILEKNYPNTFCWFRKYTYQIYLLHMFSIACFKFLYKVPFFHNDYGYIVLWSMSFVTALLFPVVVCKIVEKLPKLFRLFLGLK